MTETIKLDFKGPYSWLPGQPVPNLAEVEIGAQAGIYIWTVPSKVGELVYYVGETARSFSPRMEEHLAEQISGRYRIYKPDAFLRGVKDLLWRGVYGRGAQPNLAGFVDQLPNWAPALVQFVRCIRFHVAPTTCSDRLRKRIEAALADHLKHCDEPVGSFLAAVTNSDTLNAAVAHTAREYFKVPIVVVRNYDPALRPVIEAFVLQTVNSTSLGAQRVEELLTNPAQKTGYSAGNGEVEVYEVTIPDHWKGLTIGELLHPLPECFPVALTRAGRALLPDAAFRLEPADVLNVSSTFDGIRALAARLEKKAKA